MSLRKSTFHYFFFFYCIISSYSETDTLKQGDQLTNDEYLVSAGKVFTLGFFSPQKEHTIGYFNPEDAQNFYIGIWYTYDEQKRPVWIANRDKPISRTSGSLTIDRTTGDFKILDKGSTQLLLKSDQQGGSSKRVAVLNDTGNFVLREQSSDRILWQSFDYPTNTLLIGMKIGFNIKEGKTWSLSSWLSGRFPASGPFSLGLDPNGNAQLIMWRRGRILWRSGIWHNGKFPNLTDYQYKFNYVSNDDEKYFSLSATTSWYDISFPMYCLDWNGLLLNFDSAESDRSRYGPQYSMSTVVKCEVYYDRPGCVKQKLPECRTETLFDSTRGYALLEGLKYNDIDRQIMAISDCEEKCLNNCSCVAYASIYANGTGCELWNNMTLLHEDGDSSHRELFLQKIRYQEKEQKVLRVLLIVATASFLPLLALAWLSFYMKRTLLNLARCFGLVGYVARRNLMEYLTNLYDRLHNSLETAAGASHMEERTGLTELESSVGHSKRFPRKRRLTIGKKNHGIQMFSFESMVQATGNFSPSNKLGHGGYGTVYKGTLANNQEIAIKRLSGTSKQGKIEFTNEIKLVAKLQHTNLVKLIGYCIDQGEKMVVYEYMQNKSLDYFLFDSGRKLLLDWKKRFNIIEGVAQGLLYLHKYSRLKIIHRDLKTGNILLDQEMNPKISDFGMARLFRQNESGANTNRLVGTLGYMSPEYARDGYVSVKSDVYSFGILLLEIISNKKNNDSYSTDRMLNLVGHAWELWTENRGSEVIDQTSIIDIGDHEEAMKCINIGLLCVQENPDDRPTMSTVITMIHSEANQLPKPNKPAFFIDKGLTHAHRLLHDLEQGSLNEGSVSEMEAR